MHIYSGTWPREISIWDSARMPKILKLFLCRWSKFSYSWTRMICNAALWVLDAIECWMWSLRRYLTFSSRSSVLGVLGVLDSIYYLMIFAPRHFWTLVHKFPIDYYHYFAWLSINQPRLREGKAEENIEVNFSTGAWWRWSQPRSIHNRIFFYVSMWIEWIFGLWEPISGDVVKVINVTHLYFIFHLLRNVFPARAPGQVLRQLGRRRREVPRPQLPVSSVRRRGRVRVAGARARDWRGKTAGVDGVRVASLQMEVISSVMVILIA